MKDELNRHMYGSGKYAYCPCCDGEGVGATLHKRKAKRRMKRDARKQLDDYEYESQFEEMDKTW